jgi:hypothetical protein
MDIFGSQEIVGLVLPAGSYIIWTSLHNHPYPASGETADCRVQRNGAPVDLPSSSFLVDGNTTTTTINALTFASTFAITANCIDPGDFFNIHHHPTIDGSMIAIRMDQIN